MVKRAMSILNGRQLGTEQSFTGGVGLGYQDHEGPGHRSNLALTESNDENKWRLKLA